MTVAPLSPTGANPSRCLVTFGPGQSHHCNHADATTQETFRTLSGFGHLLLEPSGERILLIPNEVQQLPRGTSFTILSGERGLAYQYDQLYFNQSDED